MLPVVGDENPFRGHLLSGKPPRGWARFRELFGNRGRQRRERVETRLDEILRSEKPDVVWFHNIAGGGKWGWSEAMIPIARNHAPVLWTLHDMWALGSGGESYWEISIGGKGKMGTGESVGKVGRRAGSKVEKVCGEKGKYPVRLTAPSKWLAELTHKITGAECDHLPNPIDLDFFSPGNPGKARRRLGLPEKGVVILAGADSLKDPRKGFDLLIAAWDQLHPAGATLALFGRHGQAKPGLVYLGNLVSDGEMVAAYQAADLYVHPARMENAPCMIQESLACGTPVLAFPVGGISEMIIDEKSGFLAKECKIESLRATLTKVLMDPPVLGVMGNECWKQAHNIWDPNRLSQRFSEILRGLSLSKEHSSSCK